MHWYSWTMLQLLININHRKRSVRPSIRSWERTRQPIPRLYEITCNNSFELESYVLNSLAHSRVHSRAHSREFILE